VLSWTLAAAGALRLRSVRRCCDEEDEVEDEEEEGALEEGGRIRG
jgi:hypothetical protein